MTQLRRLLWPSVMTLAMLAVLLGLGTWQVERLAWKQRILTRIAASEAGPPVPLTPDPEPYAKARVEGRLRGDLSALYGAEVRATPQGPQMGGQLIVPLERPGAPSLLVDRGWVPAVRPAPVSADSGLVTLDGFVRPADKPGLFSARDDPVGRRFYTLDPAAIGAALGLGRVEPFTLVALGPPPPELYPDPARHLPQPTNNHLSYAITWFGLALSLVAIFAVWARRAWRSGGPRYSGPL
jgi:surfeit locus 1 family protein